MKNFYNLPPSWDPGYVIPKYVMAEPVGRGAFVTQQLPRGTISGVRPDFNRVPTNGGARGQAATNGCLGGCPMGSLGDDTLGTGASAPRPRRARRPMTAGTPQGAARPFKRGGPRKDYGLPRAWDSGYVVPDYVQAETPGMGAYATQWMPRGTIIQEVPDFGMANPKRVLGRSDVQLGSLGDDTLGSGAVEQNPVAAYGTSAASWLLASMQRIPAPKRPAVFKAIFDQIDRSLWPTVQKETARLQRQGMSARAALGQAIATSMSAGMVKELVALGKGGSPKKTGHVALGAAPAARSKATTYALEALGFGWSDLNPVNVAKTVGSGIASGAEAVASGTAAGAGGVWSGITTAAGAVADAATSTASFVADAVKTVGNLACDVIGNDVYKGATQVTAAALTGSPQAAQAAGTGIDVQRKICGSSSPAAVKPPPPPPPKPSWIMPALLGVGILGAGALILGRK